MGYIIPEYYTDTFQGTDAGDDLEKFISRASDAIDQVTFMKLKSKPFNEQPQLIQELVKKATASQVEFYVLNGGDAVVNQSTGIESASIGSFSYNQGQDKGKQQTISTAAINYLKHTGLLYSGLDVVQNAWY